MENNTCSTCTHAEERKYYDVLFCHRYPPVDNEFPTTSRKAWCGEYAPLLNNYVEGI
jgi:hypothetical protein